MDEHNFEGFSIAEIIGQNNMDVDENINNSHIVVETNEESTRESSQAEMVCLKKEIQELTQKWGVIDEIKLNMASQRNEMIGIMTDLTGMISNMQGNRDQVKSLSSDRNQITSDSNISTPTQEKDQTKMTLKPKDIDMLTLKDLSSIEGVIIKTAFFDQIRKTADTESKRVEVALSRMERDLRLYVMAKLNQMNENRNLQMIDQLLCKEFQGPQCLADAIRTMYRMEYSLDENPREFAHRFKTKFEALCQAFPLESRPNYMPILKSVMIKHLDVVAKSQLEMFTTEGFREEIFISEVERIRSQQVLSVNQVKQNSSPPQNTMYHQGRRPYNFKGNQRVTQRPCPYCRNGQYHMFRDCPRKPLPGSCFDCLSTMHRQGHPVCEGRQIGSEGRQDHRRSTE